MANARAKGLYPSRAMSAEEEEATLAGRLTGAAFALAALSAVCAPLVEILWLLVCLAWLTAYALGFWCAKAKGYPAYLALAGPLGALMLPSLHPYDESIRRWEAARSKEDVPPSRAVPVAPSLP